MVLPPNLNTPAGTSLISAKDAPVLLAIPGIRGFLLPKKYIATADNISRIAVNPSQTGSIFLDCGNFGDGGVGMAAVGWSGWVSELGLVGVWRGG